MLKYGLDSDHSQHSKLIHVIAQEPDVHRVPHRDQLHHPQRRGLGRGSGETLEGWNTVCQVFVDIDQH